MPALTVAVLLVLSATPPAGPIKLAAPVFNTLNLPEQAGSYYADHFGQLLGQYGFQVVTSTEINALVGVERQKQLLGCSNHASSCMAELANALGVYASQRLMWHALRGDLTEIGPELDAFVDAHSLGGGMRPFRALARLARGDGAAARAEFQTLIAAGLAPAERGVMARTYLAGLAALCVALRDREHAPMLYECVARRADLWSIGGGQTLGPWALALGSLARLCGPFADVSGRGSAIAGRSPLAGTRSGRRCLLAESGDDQGAARTVPAYLDDALLGRALQERAKAREPVVRLGKRGALSLHRFFDQ